MNTRALIAEHTIITLKASTILCNVFLAFLDVVLHIEAYMMSNCCMEVVKLHNYLGKCKHSYI